MGIDTYEPSWFHLAFLLGIVVILTYPCSIILSACGYFQTNKRAKATFKNSIQKSNEIVKAQLTPFLIAFLIGIVFCTFLLFAWIIIGGVLVKITLIKPIDNLFYPVLMF